MHVDPRTVRFFSLDILTLASRHTCSWANLTPLEYAADDDTLVTAVRVRTPDGRDRRIDHRQVPTAARQAASHSRATGRLQRAVLDYDARYMQPRDAHDVVQYLLTYTIQPRPA